MLQNAATTRCGTQFAPPIFNDEADEIKKVFKALNKFQPFHMAVLRFFFIQAKLTRSLKMGQITSTDLKRKTGVSKVYLHPALLRLASEGFIRITGNGSFQLPTTRFQTESWKEIELNDLAYEIIDQLELFNMP